MPSDLPPGFDEESLRRFRKQAVDAADRMRQVLNPELLDSINRMSQIVLPPAALEGMKRLNDQMLDQSRAMQRMVGSTLAPAIEKWSLQLPKIDVGGWVEQLRPMIEEAQRAFAEAIPPNWQNLPFEDLMDVVHRVEESGHCLVWLPREEVVREVLAADQADTAKVLASRRDDVLDDADAILGEVTAPDLELERDAALAAIRALREGHAQAGQALASSVFTSAVHSWFVMGTTASRRRMLETHPQDARIQELRLRTIYLAGAHALSEFRPDRAWPIKRDFNRHNTAHRITAEQWTEANALSAIMLSTALLRELQFWAERESLEPSE